jgi:hypothetical protein
MKSTSSKHSPPPPHKSEYPAVLIDEAGNRIAVENRVDPIRGDLLCRIGTWQDGSGRVFIEIGGADDLPNPDQFLPPGAIQAVNKVNGNRVYLYRTNERKK